MALEDKLDQVKGAVKENAGKFKDAVEGAISGLKNALGNDDK